MEKYIYILLVGTILVSMAVCMVEDICKKQIHTAVVVLFIVASIMMAWYEQREWTCMAAGSVWGILFFIISICTCGKIGKGDAFFILGIGVYMGFWTSFMIIFAAMFLVCVYGLFLLKKKKGWKYEVAFVPFLTISYVLAAGLQIYDTYFTV